MYHVREQPRASRTVNDVNGKRFAFSSCSMSLFILVSLFVFSLLFFSFFLFGQQPVCTRG